MCSKNCPCNAKDNEEYVTQWTEMSESDVNKFGRTHLEQADNMVPLVWVYVDSNEDVYSNFLDCFSAIEKGTAQVQDSVKEEYKKIGEDPKFETGV